MSDLLLSVAGMEGLATKWVTLVQDRTILNLKSPGFVPFGDNLNNFGPNFATLTVSLLIRYTYHISARCVARALLLYNSQSERDVTIIGHGQYHSITVLPQVGQGSGTFICAQYLSCIACPRKNEPRSTKGVSSKYSYVYCTS